MARASRSAVTFSAASRRSVATCAVVVASATRWEALNWAMSHPIPTPMTRPMSPTTMFVMARGSQPPPTWLTTVVFHRGEQRVMVE